MQEQKLYDILENSKNIAICVTSVGDLDKISSALLLSKIFRAQGKSSAILFPVRPSKKVIDFLEKYDCNYQTNIDPVRYVIRIDYSKTPIEKVSYDTDEEHGKINFFITPKGKEFDFDNVEYDKVGIEFDMTILIGAKSSQEMGHIYNDNTSLFRKSKLITISEDCDSPAFYEVNISQGTYSENILMEYRTIVAKLVKTDSNFITSFYEIVAFGILTKKKVEDLVTESKYLELLIELKNNGVDLKALARQMQMMFDRGNYDIQSALFKNIIIDEENKIVWSGIDYHTVEKAGLDATEIVQSAGIIFNKCDEFDLAIEVIETEKSKLQVTIESNNIDKYSALKIASVFEGTGTDERATCIVKNASIADFENIIYPVLKDLYGINR